MRSLRRWRGVYPQSVAHVSAPTLSGPNNRILVEARACSWASRIWRHVFGDFEGSVTARSKVRVFSRFENAAVFFPHFLQDFGHNPSSSCLLDALQCHPSRVKRPPSKLPGGIGSCRARASAEPSFLAFPNRPYFDIFAPSATAASRTLRMNAQFRPQTAIRRKRSFARAGHWPPSVQ